MSSRAVLSFWIALVLAGAVVMAPAVAQASSEGGGDAAESAKKALNPLESLQRDTALFTAVVFGLLMLILWKWAWRPIADSLDKREQRIAGEIAAAEKANLDARQLLADYQAKLAGSEAKVREILDQGRRDAELLGRELLDKARAEADLERQRALREIETATAGALKELAERSATLAVELAGKILRQRLDPKAHARLIDEAVSRFAGTKHNGN